MSTLPPPQRFITNEMELFSSDAIIKLDERTRFHQRIRINVYTDNFVYFLCQSQRHVLTGLGIQHSCSSTAPLR